MEEGIKDASALLKKADAMLYKEKKHKGTRRLHI
jgi:hypothetical protein